MIDKIGDQCTGCYSCINVCPKKCLEMIDDSEGFWFPEIDMNSCISCNLCEKHCPVLTPIPIDKRESEIKVYALKHKDEEILRNSSSGGAFSAIAEYVLSKGGVVFGAAFDKNYNVHHICIEHPDQLEQLRGSKYVQSRIGDTYTLVKEYLKDNRLVLFSGTACQTSGLIAYLGGDDENLITQDLVCHGVPSPMAWRKYIKLREQLAKSKIKKVFFRDKTFGWHNWHIAFWFEDGSQYKENQREDMMIKSFLRGKCSRKSCYSCKFKQKARLADFTLADFWGIEKIDPSLNDEKGLSSVYVNSPKAARIIEAIKDKVDLWEKDVDQAISNNLAMVESETMREDRKGFLRDLRQLSFDMVSGKYNDEIGIGTKIRWTLRRWMGNKNYESVRHMFKRG